MNRQNPDLCVLIQQDKINMIRAESIWWIQHWMGKRIPREDYECPDTSYLYSVSNAESDK